jgi:hypothetical protein
MGGAEKSEGQLDQDARQIDRGNCFHYMVSKDVRNIAAQLHNDRDKQQTENKLANREYPAEGKYSMGLFGELHGPESLLQRLKPGNKKFGRYD